MAVVPFTQILSLSSSLSSVYTNPSSTISQIGSLLIHNLNTVSETVDIHFVPNSGGSPGTPVEGNRIFRFVLAAGDSMEFSQKFPWTLSLANDAIFAKTSTASKVTMTISGVKNT